MSSSLNAGTQTPPEDTTAERPTTVLDEKQTPTAAVATAPLAPQAQRPQRESPLAARFPEIIERDINGKATGNFLRIVRDEERGKVHRVLGLDERNGQPYNIAGKDIHLMISPLDEATTRFVGGLMEEVKLADEWAMADDLDLDRFDAQFPPTADNEQGANVVLNGKLFSAKALGKAIEAADEQTKAHYGNSLRKITIQVNLVAEPDVQFSVTKSSEESVSVAELFNNPAIRKKYCGKLKNPPEA